MRRQLSDSAEENPLKLRLMGVRMSDFKQDYDADAEGSSCKRQRTMDSFVNRTTHGQEEEQNKFECPSCLKAIPARSEFAFNLHLDKCLSHSEM